MNVNVIWTVKERYKERKNQYTKNIWERQFNVERTAMKSKSLGSFSKLPLLFPKNCTEVTESTIFSVSKIRENAYLIGNLGIEKSVSYLLTYQVSCTKMRFPQLLPNAHFYPASPPYLCWAVPQLPFSSQLSVTVPGSLQPLFPHICSRDLCDLWAGGHSFFEGVSCLYRSEMLQNWGESNPLGDRSIFWNKYLARSTTQEKVKSLTQPIWQGLNNWVNKFDVIKSVGSYFSWGFFPIC